MKSYVLKNIFGRDYILAPIKRKYLNNGLLAIELIDVETEEEFATLTVNLDYPHSEDNECLVFIDTNNCIWAEQFIEEYDLGTKTGYYGFSGFCCYPEYQIKLDKLNIE